MIYDCPVVLDAMNAAGKDPLPALEAAADMLPAERLRGLPVRPPALPEPPDETTLLQSGEFLPGVY
eukprot:4028470-Alexandrium_andersonii.AAC.1